MKTGPGLSGSAKTTLIGVLALGLAGGIGTWWALGVLGEKTAELAALQERLGNPALASLLGETTGTSRASQEAAQIRKMTQTLQEEEGASSRRWSVGTQEARGQGKDWAKDPGKWKDELIARQNELQKKASSERVLLAPDFYLGLQEYQQKSPTADEVPDLAVQLSVAGRLVERLLEARKIREQYTTDCELKSLALVRKGENQDKVPPGTSSATAPKGPSAVPERKKFRLELKCSPEVLYEYVRLLASDDWLLIIQNLSVSNEKPDFPPRSEIAKKFGSVSAGDAGRPGDSAAGKKLLEVLSGDEALSVGMEIDFIAWQEAEAAKPPADKGPKP